MQTLRLQMECIRGYCILRFQSFAIQIRSLGGGHSLAIWPYEMHLMFSVRPIGIQTGFSINAINKTFCGNGIPTDQSNQTRVLNGMNICHSPTNNISLTFSVPSPTVNPLISSVSLITFTERTATTIILIIIIIMIMRTWWLLLLLFIVPGWPSSDGKYSKINNSNGNLFLICVTAEEIVSIVLHQMRRWSIVSSMDVT